jgi:tetratricopeptide (TPR) repeat protein
MNLLRTAALATLLSCTAARAADYGAFLTSQFAARQGDLNLAASEILSALGADPANPSLQKDAFALALLAGRPEAEILAAKVPQSTIAQLLLADAAGRAGNWQRAELGYAELPHDTVMDGLRPLLLAWSQQAQGLTDKALDTLQAGIDSGHMTAFYLLHAALIADVAHRDGLADRLYSTLQKQMAEPNVRVAQILASWQARNGHPEAARSDILALGGESSDIALALPGMLGQLDKMHVANPRQGIAEAYAGMAGSVRQDKDSELTPLLLQLSLRMEPKLAEAHLVLADIATTQHHFRAAANELRAIDAPDPLFPLAQLHLADDESRIGEVPAARARLEHLATLFPDQSTPLARLGDILMDSQDYSGAATAYTGAILRLKSPSTQDWVLFYARGAARERLHEWEAAEADAREALKLSPNQPSALNFLGFAWAERNRNLLEAREMIQRALTQRPNDGAIVDSLGWVLLRLGDTKRAVQLLEQAAELMPADPTITGHLGDAYWQAGRHVEATDQWRQALILKPDADEQTRIAGRLRTAGAE